MSVMIHKRKSYGHIWAVYYCSEEKVKLYGGVDKVPLYVCGVEYIVQQTHIKETGK